MKKKFMTAFAVLLLVTITGFSEAAQKAITQYSRASGGIIGGGPIIPTGGPGGDLGDPIVTKSGAVTTTPTTINLGGNIYDGAGAVWYQGDSDLAYCTSGACSFGQGLRAFFNFQFTNTDSSGDSTNSADGFVFAILNSNRNTDGSGIPNRTGGAPTQTSMGELMGYAGPGGTADKLGLRPPKMGIEFDTFPNADGDICASESRNDTPLGTNFRNHIALMFWGDDLAGNCTYGWTNFPQSSFDDNRHGSGNNSSNPGTADPLSGYYTNPAAKPGGTYNWMEDGAVHKFRIEIDRSTKTDGSGNGLYTTRVWVDCNGTSCSTSEATHFQDVVNLYTDTLPQINRTVELSQADHLLMNRMLFGFTEATGGATQIANITNFMIYFPKTPPAPPCTYAISPASQSFSNSSGSGTVTVTAGTGCIWTASVTSGGSWISITSGSNGTGNGSVGYSVTANTGIARTGAMMIAGQNFTVNQNAAAPTCTLTPSPSIVPYNNTTNLAWTIANGPANGTWSVSPGGTCSNFSGSNGGSCTTGNQTTVGARTYTLTVSNANGSSSCSATFYVGCAGYRVWNNTGSTWDFRVTGQSCRTSRSTGSEITTSTSSTWLQPGETVSRYTTFGTGCSSSVQGSITYTSAVSADINGNCQVNYNSGDTVGDR